MLERASRSVRFPWPLALLLVATGVAYAPALTAPFWLDDYIYLVAARDLPTMAYVRTAFTPWANEPLLPFAHSYWRPLAFLWFEGLEPLAGGDPLPYHLFLLLGHLAAVLLTWFVAARVDPRPGVRVLAAAVVALHPGLYEAVAWVSSVNSVALPLSLGAWLAFLHATERGGPVRWPLVALSAFLLALGAMTRESAWVVLPVLVGWHIAVTSRWRLIRWDTWRPLLPYGLLAVVYVLVRTRLFTQPLADPFVFAWGEHVWPNYRTSLGFLLLPFREVPVEEMGWRHTLQQLSVPILPVLTLALAAMGRWRPAVLLAGALLSILGFAPNHVGVSARYLYFTVPWFALGLGFVAADLHDRLPEGALRRAAVLAGVAATLVVAGTLYNRVSYWSDSSPREEQAWLDTLRAQYPTLPPGSTVVATGTVPHGLTILGEFSIEAAVRWYYPEASGARYVPPEETPVLGPGEVLFVAP